MTSAFRLLRARLRARLKYMRATGRLRRVVLLLTGGVLLLGIVWIAVTGYFARSQEDELQTGLRQVKALVSSGQIEEARQVADGLPALATRAHRLTTGPAWWIASEIPYLGDPFKVVRGSTDAVQEVGTHGVPALLQVAASLDPKKLRTAGASIDTAPLVAAAPELATAAQSLDAARAEVDKLPHSTWLSAVNGPRQTLAAQLKSIGDYVDAAARAAKILPTMLGNGGPKRYFIGLQNESEMRGTGGLPGAFAIMVADHGKVKFSHFESDQLLLPRKTGHLINTGLDFGKDYASTYGASDPTRLYINSNLSPNFPYAAQIWAAMWQKTSGERVDGAIALDPTVLSYVLAGTGPVKLPGGASLTAQNVVSLTEKDEYSLFPNTAKRKAYLVAVLKAASSQLTSGAGDATALAKAMSQASQEQRLLVWFDDPTVESVLRQTNYAGAIPQGDAPFVGLTMNNTAAGKLDYYLTRSLNYQRSGCGATRDVLVTITLTNTAPASGLPRYVTTRLDKHDFPVKPGDNRTLVDYFATAGAQVLSATLNEKPTTVALEHGLGHPIFRVDVEMPRGKTQTIVLHLREPAGKGAPVVWRQPGVTPLSVTVVDQHCG